MIKRNYSDLFFLFIGARLILTFLFFYFDSPFEIYYFVLNPVLAFITYNEIKKMDIQRYYATAILCLDLVFPVFGLLIVLSSHSIYVQLNKIFRGKEDETYELPFGNKRFHLYENHKKSLIEYESDNEVDDKLFSASQIEPYLDIIASDNTEKKLGAIEKLSRIHNPKSVILLKKALQDPIYEVRYFASIALEKLEEHYTDLIELHTDDISKDPNGYHSYRERSMTYFELCYLGLDDLTTKSLFLSRSLTDLETSLEFEPNQENLLLKKIQIYHYMGDFDHVLSTATEILRNPLLQKEKAKILFYRAEANFNLGRFVEVIDNCKDLEISETDTSGVEEAQQYWQSFNFGGVYGR